MVECLTRDRRRHCVVSLSKNIIPSLLLVQPRKNRPFITERLLMGRKESNQTNKNLSHRLKVSFCDHRMPVVCLSSPLCGVCQQIASTTSPKLLDPEVIKLFPCSSQLSTKFILLINVKMPTIVGILTLISMINATSERPKARTMFICGYLSFYEQLKFHAQLS